MPHIVANQNHNKARQTCLYLMEYIVHTCIQYSVQMITFWPIRFPFCRIEGQIMGSCRMSFEIEHFIYITHCKAHESTKNWYSNYNKTKLNKTICIFYCMYCVCSNVCIRSQRSLLLTWSPFDFSALTKPFMILVNMVRRPTTIGWDILEPYHLVTSLQVVWN